MGKALPLIVLVVAGFAAGAWVGTTVIARGSRPAARHVEAPKPPPPDVLDAVELGRSLKDKSPNHAVALFGIAVGRDARNREARTELAGMLGPGEASDRLLGPVMGEAKLVVTTEPADAVVTISERGTLPYLKPGKYVVSASSEGHADGSFRVELAEGITTRLLLRLPSGAAPEGFRFVSDGKGGGAFLSIACVTVGEFNAFQASRGGETLEGEVGDPAVVGIEDAQALAASKGARLPTNSELLHAGGGVESKPSKRFGEWSVDGGPWVYEYREFEKPRKKEKKCAFRLVKDLP